MDSLPKAEKKIAQAIIDAPEDTIYLSAKQLGEKAGASAPTVVRFCRRLEVDGFTQLKLMISSELSKIKDMGYSDISADENFYEIKEKLLGNAHQSLVDTSSLIKEEEVNSTIQLIENADVIYVYGVGSSYLVAENFAQKWRRIGKMCIVEKDAHNMITIITSNSKKALFVGISNSGETKEVVKLMQLAHKIGCPTLSITQFGKNSVSDYADVSLRHVRANEQLYRSAATASLHVQFYIVDILFHSYASKHYEEALNRILVSRRAIKEYNQ